MSVYAKLSNKYGGFFPSAFKWPFVIVMLTKRRIADQSLLFVTSEYARVIDFICASFFFNFAQLQV